MALLGRSVTVVGVLLIVAPLIGVALSFVDIGVPMVVEYAPSFILGGIFVFVVGIALQTFGR